MIASSRPWASPARRVHCSPLAGSTTEDRAAAVRGEREPCCSGVSSAVWVVFVAGDSGGREYVQNRQLRGPSDACQPRAAYTRARPRDRLHRWPPLLDRLACEGPSSIPNWTRRPALAGRLSSWEQSRAREPSHRTGGSAEVRTKARKDRGNVRTPCILQKNGKAPFSGFGGWRGGRTCCTVAACPSRRARSRSVAKTASSTSRCSVRSTSASPAPPFARPSAGWPPSASCRSCSAPSAPTPRTHFRLLPAPEGPRGNKMGQ